jgi:hypothetical protein
VNVPAKLWSKRAAFLVLTAGAIYLFLPALLKALGAGVGAILTVLACILGICILPLFAMWFFGFVYWFAKPHLRAWHINHIRNNRLLKEAADRGRDAG